MLVLIVIWIFLGIETFLMCLYFDPIKHDSYFQKMPIINKVIAYGCIVLIVLSIWPLFMFTLIWNKLTGKI